MFKYKSVSNHRFKNDLRYSTYSVLFSGMTDMKDKMDSKITRKKICPFSPYDDIGMMS